MELTTNKGYLDLLHQISDTYTQGRMQAVQAINTHITQTYWQVGRQIVAFEQAGKARAEYGKALISKLAADLGLRHGKGFSRTNLVYMRLLYQRYPITQKPSPLLSWSHYVELLKLDDDLERSFYEQQAINEKWSVQELKRQKNSALFLQLAASHLPNEQPAFCTEIPALPARTRGTAPRAGADTARSSFCQRTIAINLIATYTINTGARGRFFLNMGFKSPIGLGLAAALKVGTV